MKRNLPTMTICGVLAATTALSACSAFGSVTEPEPPRAPGLPAGPAEPTTQAPIPTPSVDPEPAPRWSVHERSVPDAAEAIRDDFAVAIEIADDEAICLDQARISEVDYVGLFEKGNQPTIAAAAALNDCLSDDHDRELAAWLVEHRFSLDNPSTCFRQELSEYVTDTGWVVFITAADQQGYAAFEPVYASCGEQPPTTTSDVQRADATTDATALGEVMASLLATAFGLDDASTACMSPSLGVIIDEYGIEALSAAFDGDTDDFDLTSHVARATYTAVGECAPLPGVYVRDTAVVGMVRSMGTHIGAAGQACLATGFDEYADVAGVDELFVGFHDLVRENDTGLATDIAEIINACVAASDLEPTEGGAGNSDIDYVTGLAAELNFLDGSQQICLGFWMPGIVEQYGYEQVQESLTRAIDEIGYRDDIIDQVALAAVDCS